VADPGICDQDWDSGNGQVRARWERVNIENARTAVAPAVRHTVSQSIDWYSAGQERSVMVGNMEVIVRFVGRKGRRGRISITAPAGAVYCWSDTQWISNWSGNRDLGRCDLGTLERFALVTKDGSSWARWPRPYEQQKVQLAEAMTKDVMDVLALGEKSISVAVKEVEPEDWAEKVYEPELRLEPLRAIAPRAWSALSFTPNGCNAPLSSSLLGW
jgi:phenylpyruvate tautomerase PptA (4-oxalocrotonate tautomerase family)